LTYRIQRSTTPDTVTFTLSGEIGSEQVAGLREFLANEPDGPVVLDLRDITLVDRAAVRFLASVEPGEIRIVNCPEYVRSWITAERSWQDERRHQSGMQEAKP
jgi:hypothetical protein